MTFYIVGVTKFISNWQNESLGHNLISNKQLKKLFQLSKMQYAV